MPFQPGQSGNPHGRPKGSRNKSSLAVREWATRIVEDPKVQARLLADARTGKLHPSVLTVLMTYAYGRPNPRDVPEPETPITIELNIPKPPGVIRRDSTGSPPSPLTRYFCTWVQKSLATPAIAPSAC